MIIRLSPGRYELLDTKDFGRLKIRVPAGWSAQDIAHALPFAAKCTADFIWMREVDLRELVQSRTSADDPVSGMVEKARTYGFYDDASGAIRVHIENC